VLLGLRQADLARQIGISPSYLNLIEHNRRRIGGKLLNDIARELTVEPAHLTEGAGAALIAALREAANDVGPDASADTAAPSAAELDRLEEFIGRFPGWATLTAETARRARASARTVEMLSDRLTHDPFLSASLHEVISAVTSIRATAAILNDTGDIDPEWQTRFHRNLDDDARRLSEGAGALVGYLDANEGEAASTATPQEEFDRWLGAQGHHLEALEDGAVVPPDSPHLQSAASRDLAARWSRRYAAAARAMPLHPFVEACAELRHDPLALAQRFAQPLICVFIRLASLPSALLGEQVAGLVICDGAGAITYRKPVEGFALPRFSAACSLWPLYGVLSRPGSARRDLVEMAGSRGSRFLTYATATLDRPAGYDGPEVAQAAMLILPIALGAELPKEDPALPVGPACRICPRRACPARRELSILSDQD
jgi:transcriptional regulator with XRE-family HTH domain